MNSTTRSWLNVIVMTLGLWTILSAWWLNITGYALWSSVIVGGFVFILGSIREWNETSKTVWASWGNVLLGIWLLASPFFFEFTDTTQAFANVFITGAFIIVFAGWSTLGSNLKVHQ